MKLLNPRKANNAFFNFNLEETKYQIKRNLIENFEYIQKEVSNDLKLLNARYSLFIIGLIFLMAPWLYHGIKGFFQLSYLINYRLTEGKKKDKIDVSDYVKKGLQENKKEKKESDDNN